MTGKKSSRVMSNKSGYYTVHVPKSATTGKFVVESKSQGKIIIRSEPRKAS